MCLNPRAESRCVGCCTALSSWLFLMMAAIQFNDPDPVYWVADYGLVAAVPLARIFRRRLPKVSLLAGGMVLAGLLIAVPGFVDFLVSGDYASINGKMSPEKPYMESARESIGLLIAAICLNASALGAGVNGHRGLQVETGGDNPGSTMAANRQWGLTQ